MQCSFYPDAVSMLYSQCTKIAAVGVKHIHLQVLQLSKQDIILSAHNWRILNRLSLVDLCQWLLRVHRTILLIRHVEEVYGKWV